MFSRSEPIRSIPATDHNYRFSALLVDCVVFENNCKRPTNNWRNQWPSFRPCGGANACFFFWKILSQIIAGIPGPGQKNEYTTTIDYKLERKAKKKNCLLLMPTRGEFKSISECTNERHLIKEKSLESKMLFLSFEAKQHNDATTTSSPEILCKTRVCIYI
jgi:hypothetical protein